MIGITGHLRNFIACLGIRPPPGKARRSGRLVIATADASSAMPSGTDIEL
jgi:hypothetical protein